eukprot:2037590-Rhodomonas_salina.2
MTGRVSIDRKSNEMLTPASQLKADQGASDCLSRVPKGGAISPHQRVVQLLQLVPQPLWE